MPSELLPETTCPVIRSFLDALFPTMPDDAPAWHFNELVEELADTDSQVPAIEVRRAVALADGICRRVAPMALRAVGQWPTALQIEEVKAPRDARQLLELSVRLAEVDYRYAKPGMVLTTEGPRQSARVAAAAIELAVDTAGTDVYTLVLEIVRSMLAVPRKVPVSELPLHEQTWCLLEQEESYAAELCTVDEQCCIASIHWHSLSDGTPRELVNDPASLAFARALVSVPQMKRFVMSFLALESTPPTDIHLRREDKYERLRDEALGIIHAIEHGAPSNEAALF